MSTCNKMFSMKTTIGRNLIRFVWDQENQQSITSITNLDTNVLEYDLDKVARLIPVELWPQFAQDEFNNRKTYIQEGLFNV